VLTPVGANNANSVATLVSVESTSKILISGRRYSFGTGVALGTGS
jgi:hypothetical protein